MAVHCYTQKQLMAWDNLELLKVQEKLLQELCPDKKTFNPL